MNMLLRGLLEPRIFRAPEDDQGADFDEPIDDEIDIDDAEPEDDEDDAPIAGAGEEEDEGPAEPPPTRQPSRAQARVETALREAREAKAELARLREQQNQGQTREQQERAQAAERERLADMDPEQRLEYRIQQQERAHQQQIARLEFTMQDSADKTAFEGLAARNPVAAKLKDQVEERLAELRRGGTTAPRETVLRWVIGDRALANAGRAKGKATRKADANRNNQTTRPGSSRGDTAGEGRGGNDSAAARRKRLDGINI